MLEILKENRLTCNPEKCDIAFSKLEFLGREISAEGISLSSKKIAIIQKIALPKTRQSLQRLLGMFNYHRKFLKNYPQNTYNMRQLLLKEAEFKWTDECQRELDYLKACLQKEPILQALDPTKDLTIMVDAANKTGFGWQLMKTDDNNVLRTVSYGGQALSKSQLSWSPAQTELAGLALALRQYECYAIMRQVNVITDNSQVLHLETWHPVNVREKRLIAYLMQFKLKITFVKGCHNVAADALSRVFDDMPEEHRKAFLPQQDEREDFVVSVTETDSLGPSLTKDNVKGDDGEVRLYSFEWNDGTEAVGENTQLNPQAQVFVPRNDTIDQETEYQRLQAPIQQTAHQQTHASTRHDACAIDEQWVDSSAASTQSDVPKLTFNDCLTDTEFRPICLYLTKGELTGDDAIDRQTLLMADQYYIRDESIYKLGLPRNRREARVHPLLERLCIPKAYRLALLMHWHDKVGHIASHRLFLTISRIVY